MNLTTKQLEVFNLILSLETNREIRSLNTESHRLQKVVEKEERNYNRLAARLEKLNS